MRTKEQIREVLQELIEHLVEGEHSYIFSNSTMESAYLDLDTDDEVRLVIKVLRWMLQEETP